MTNDIICSIAMMLFISSIFGFFYCVAVIGSRLGVLDELFSIETLVLSHIIISPILISRFQPVKLNIIDTWLFIAYAISLQGIYTTLFDYFYCPTMNERSSRVKFECTDYWLQPSRKAIFKASSFHNELLKNELSKYN